MTHDDIRKLVGGYATGSLTEAERKLLFEAALDDQDLFDELAREQAFKEVLDDPGAKQRLIAALQPAETRVVWWQRPLVWSSALVVATGIIATSWITLRQSPKVEVAEVKPLTAPAPAPQAVATVTAPSLPPAANKVTPKVAEVRGRVAEARNQPPASAPPPPQAGVAPPLAKDQVAEAPKTVAPPENQPVERASKAKEEAPRKVAEPPQSLHDTVQVAAATAAPVAPQPAPGSPAVLVAPFASSNTETESRKAGGGGGARTAEAKAFSRKADVREKHFAFDYTVDPDGYLVIKAASDGYLTVGKLFPEAFVAKDSTTRIDLASTGFHLGAVGGRRKPPMVTIHFSARRKASNSKGLSQDSDATAGRLEDPNPSDSSNLILKLTLK